MIYLDNAATTQMLPEVIDVMSQTLKTVYGNPSSTYRLGRHAKQLMEEARRKIAMSIHAQPSDIIFTSGGTESNNMALKSLAFRNEKRHIISSQIEHPSVKNTLKALEEDGFHITYLPVNEEGIVSVESVEKAIQEDTSFVTIMSVNNETGAIQPVGDIAELLKDTDILFHTDAVQAYGTLPIDVSNHALAMLSVSAHKIHGPKGIGFLYIRRNISVSPLLHGGGQEHGLRSGTENIANIVGFAKAVDLLALEESALHYQDLQTLLWDLLQKYNIPAQMNSSLQPDKHTYKVQSIWLKNVSAQKLLIHIISSIY